MRFPNSNRLIYEELELDATDTKKTTGRVSNRLFSRFFRRRSPIFGHANSNRYTKQNWREVNLLKTNHMKISNRDKDAVFGARRPERCLTYAP